MRRHQSPADLQKNYSRVRDIISKAEGDHDKEIRLAQTQAKLITKEAKAINRALAAKELGHEHIYDVFFRRAYDLGVVDKQDFRNYQLSKLGIA